jgi:hypothetical protein
MYVYLADFVLLKNDHHLQVLAFMGVSEMGHGALLANCFSHKGN